MGAITRSKTTWFTKPAQAASFQEKLKILHQDALGIHVIWTGTLNGTISIWVSNLLNPVAATDGDWVDLGLTMPANPAGSASSIFLSISGIQARWVRFKYAHTSGTGDISGYVDLEESR